MYSSVVFLCCTVWGIYCCWPVPPPLPEVTTEAIRNAWQAMADLLHEAATRANETASSGDSWLSRARTAMDASIRKSVEMRLVATLVAD